MTGARIGYVGLDHHHTEPYLASIAQLPATVTAACEPDPDPDFDGDAVAGLGDVPVYRDPETLMNEADIEALWLTLSNRDAPAVVASAAERGLDVYAEKPVARTAEELRPATEAVADSDATVCVSYTWRGYPVARDLRERAREGYFGDVQAVDARFVASQLAYRDADHYLFDREASRGGIVQWLGVHFVDLLPWILDDPIAQVNASLRYGSDAVDVEDGATVQFETESGALGTLQTGYYLTEGRYDTRIGIYGTDGRADWDPMGDEFGFNDETTLEVESTAEKAGAPRRWVTYDYDPKDGYGGAPGLLFMRDFLEVRDAADASPPATLGDALEVLQVLDAVYESASEDAWVDIDRE